MIKSKMLNCCIESSHIAHCPVLFFIRFFEGGGGGGVKEDIDSVRVRKETKSWILIVKSWKPVHSISSNIQLAVLCFHQYFDRLYCHVCFSRQGVGFSPRYLMLPCGIPKQFFLR